MTRFRKTTIATTAMTLVLIAVGGLVRATGSGLGCPSWPRCYGRWLPPLSYHALIEYSHRLAATIVIVLIGAVAVTAWRRHRREASILYPALAAVGLVIFQAALGGVVVRGDLHATLVTAHFATAMLLVAVVLAVAINAFCSARAPSRASEPRVSRDLSHLATVAAAATFVLLAIGAYVRGLGAGLAFADWPLMNGTFLPAAGRLATPHFVHRALTLVVGGLVLALAWRARRVERREPAIVAFSSAAAGLYLAQVAAGATNVWTRLSAPAVVAHVTLGALTWSATVGLAILAWNLSRPAEREAAGGAPGEQARRSAAETITAYLHLTKPRIIVLLLITTVPAMMLAAGGWPGSGLVAATLLGGSLAAGGANAINCYVDRDIDARMTRTARRPVPSGRISPAHALEFGCGLGIVAFAWLWATVNLLSAALAMAALLFYVFVYTLGLKRTTPQNIVIGGAAGAVPVLVGWTAVTGSLGLAPLVMFAIIFFWTPPHFWALAVRLRSDYARAGVPMLPVVAGARETQRQILAYSFVLVGVTLALYPAGRMGAVYLGSALVLGAWFIRLAVALWRTGSQRAARALFRYSISYLALLFAAVAADTLAHVAT
jgi:protoheme IX farnesyltransferase